MTLADILLEVGELGRGSTRLSSDYIRFINRAMMQIANRKDWSFMHNRTVANIPVGSTSVGLGATFKKLTDEQTPISYQFGIYNLPVYIASREEIEGRGIWPWTNGPAFTPIPGGQWPIRVVFMEFNTSLNQWALNIPPQFAPTINLAFNISAYYMPAPLAKGSDNNDFTNHPMLADAIVNLTKKLCYAALDQRDKDQMQAMKEAAALYEEAITSAWYKDDLERFQGRTIRM